MQLSGVGEQIDIHGSPPELRQVPGSGNSFVQTLVTETQAYYGDSLFNSRCAPRNDDEEAVFDLENDIETISLLTNTPLTPGRAEAGSPFARKGSPGETKSSFTRFFGYILVALVLIAGVVGIVAGFAHPGRSLRSRAGRRRLTMDHIFNGTFQYSNPYLNWVAEAGDGVFSQLEGEHIKLVDLKSNKTTILLSVSDVRDETGNQLPIIGWKLSDDMKHVLIKGSHVKQWRHSSFGNFYVHNIAEKRTHPITPPSYPPRTAFATWSPTGNAIAFVQDNDIYILPSVENMQPIRVTNSGNASLFHGVPDWVYEEEVLTSDYALWWSPDSSKVAFLTLDETSVPEFSFPIYNPTEDNDAVVPYIHDVVMRYPKPGYPNPLVSVHIFDVSGYLSADSSSSVADSTLTLVWDERHPANDSIIQEIAWVGDTTLLVKEVNRNADNGSVIFFDLGPSNQFKERGRVVRRLGKHGEQDDDGWIDPEQSIFPMPTSGALSSFRNQNAYLDIVPSPGGYNHIALFSPADSSQPQFLTSGEWEVTGRIHGVDSNRGLVYFAAAKPSTERQLFSVPIPTGRSEKAVEPTALTDTTKPGYYAAKFSPQAGFYVLSYLGPGIPWTKVVNAETSFSSTLEANDHLRNVTETFEAPTVVHSTFVSDGYELNVKELLPPRMDDSGRTKYPVLFRVYGGPASQMVDFTFSRDWHDYLACEHKYIIVTVDGRGTGYKGRNLRNTVKGNLGFFETIDQVNAAKAWARKPYVDPKRIGIWGWSYGGFMSSKVAEANAKVHSLAMAVAPVTSWRLYDSIYTERYMNIPSLNPGGYINASISHVEGFKELDYLFAHGSGDDNVHYANSAHLLDMFVKAQVRNYRFRMFTDSDHSIRRRGAKREIYEYLTEFLLEKWGKGGRRV